MPVGFANSISQSASPNLDMQYTAVFDTGRSTQEAQTCLLIANIEGHNDPLYETKFKLQQALDGPYFRKYRNVKQAAEAEGGKSESASAL
jgi:hypothetical protein